jgi:DNA polymerase-3 subunit gamma/tau
VSASFGSPFVRGGKTMAYQVLARKYRPQTFGDVIGQRGVTQTLRNAISKDRLAQAFIFAGPRGVGKTTTARILARALNCQQGPTPDPCGTCDACVEIAEGRDIDVLEIDAATHTQVDNVREVIIAGLGMAPVRDRYKIFIIDEFHQLSSHSFNALLKSIEEPPSHVVFMMATTELRKIPETILSRSQVYELRTIATSVIADKLQEIAKAESIAIDEAAVALIARSAEGSMRDAQSAFDQVIAFAGREITGEDVSAVLGLIGRDLVLDVAEVVADENPQAVFDLAGRFVEAGFDLRLVCRELTRAVRDMLVIAIDNTRADDPEIAGDAERSRLVELANRFSREDLMRAFDLLAKAEFEIRSAAQPRYHFEMAVLKWIHLRKLVPLTALLEGAPASATASRLAPPVKSPRPPKSPQPTPPKTKSVKPTPAKPARAKQTGAKQASPKPTPADESVPESKAPDVEAAGPGNGGGKAEILAEVKRAKKFFHGTVVAQAQRIELVDDRLVFAFTETQRTLSAQLRQNRGWLEEMASRAVGRKIEVTTEQSAHEATEESSGQTPAEADEQTRLREKAMNDPVVQTLLEVFPAEIGDVKKIERPR